MIESTRTPSLIPSNPPVAMSHSGPVSAPSPEAPLRLTMSGDTLALQSQGIRLSEAVPPVAPQAASQGFITRFLEACKAFFNTLFPRTAQTAPQGGSTPVPPGPGSVPAAPASPDSIPATGLLLTSEQARALLDEGIKQSLAIAQQLRAALPQPVQLDPAMARVQEAMMEMTHIIQTGTFQGKPVAAYGEQLVQTVNHLRAQLQTQAGPLVDGARLEIERALRTLEGVAAELSKSR